jgi:hypothetical protein
LCAIVGCTKLDSGTKLYTVKTKEAIIQEKIDALQREFNVVHAEVRAVLSKNGILLDKMHSAKTECSECCLFKPESSKIGLEFDNNLVALSERFFNIKKIAFNIAKANVELQKAKLKTGKTTKEYVKLAKLDLAIAEADIRDAVASVKATKSALKMTEFRTRIGGVITGEDRIELVKARIEETKAQLEGTIVSAEISKFWLDRADVVKIINTTAKNEDDAIKEGKIELKWANEEVAKAKSYVEECEKALKTAKANIVLQKAKSGKAAKEDIKLAKLKLDLAKIRVKESKVSLKVAECFVKVAEVQARTSNIATGENHVAEEKNSIEINKAS